MSLDRDRHADIEELISASLHGDLTDGERRRLDAHLDGCAACRATLAAFADQRRIMAGLRHVPPPRDLEARVRSGIERGRSVGRRWWQQPPTIFAGVGGGLALVTGALLALVLLGEPTEEPEVGQTSPTPSVAVATPSPAEETLVPLETAVATPIPTLPPASFVPSASVEPVPTASPPPEESPEPEVFLAVTGPSDNQAMTLREADATETGVTLAEVPTPPESSAELPAMPIAAELSPDGQWLAYIVDLGLSGQTEVRATRLAEGVPSDSDAQPPIDSPVAVGETVKLADSVSGSPFVEHLFWSPDSRHLAFTVVDRGSAGTDAWIFDPAVGAASALSDVGTAYAGSWAPGGDGTSLLWISTAGETPESHLLTIPEDAAGVIEPFDPADSDHPSANAFQPIVSPNGALVIYWTGQMQRAGDEWAFTDGGAPWLAENRPDGELGFTFDNAREVFRDVTVRQNAFASAAIRWGLDSDAYVVWDADWGGETQASAEQYPDQTRVYLTRATDPRGMTQVHTLDADDVPEGSRVIDVKLAGTGRHLAITARKPTPGDLAAPEAELFLITRNTGDVPDERETLGSGPEQWFGPAVFTQEQWAELIGE
jgi:anti-sigma factor RsiW